VGKLRSRLSTIPWGGVEMMGSRGLGQGQCGAHPLGDWPSNAIEARHACGPLSVAQVREARAARQRECDGACVVEMQAQAVDCASAIHLGAGVASQVGRQTAKLRRRRRAFDCSGWTWRFLVCLADI